MNRCYEALIIATALLMVPGVARGQSPAPDANSAGFNADMQSVAAIVMSSVGEVQLCGLAVEKTQSPDVRSFCRNAVADHTRTAVAGMQLARRLGSNGVKLEPLPGTPAALDTLSRYSGHAFDRAFLLLEIEDHENDQDALRYASQVATEPSVKRYENGVLPKVETYLHLAESTLHTISEDQP